MKTLITVLATAAATAFVYDVNAQSLEKGKKLLAYERYESAEKELSSLAGNSPEANYYYGLVLLGEGKTNEAKAAFAKHASDFRNMAGTARVLFEEGKSAEAFKILQDIVDGAKKKDWEKYQVAADAITYSDKATQYDEAIAWYRTAHERKANQPEVMIGLGDALLRKNTGESNGEAVRMFDAVIAEGKMKSLAYARHGLIWLNARNYDEALKSYNLAKESDKENPLPYGDLADVYYRAGKYELAKQNIEEYLKLSDKSIRDQMRYGNILYLTKDYTGAAKIYQDLINAGEGKKTPSLYRGLAFTQYQNDQLSEAMKNFDTYRSTVSDTAKYTYEDYLYYAYVNNAMAKEDSVNAAKYQGIADQNFTLALQKSTDKDKTELYRKIADGYKETRNWSKVSEWYSKMIAEYPESSPLDYFNAGYYAYFAKDFTGAKAKLEAFNAKYPDEILGLYWLGRVAAAQDPEAKTGTAVEPFKTWLNKPLAEGKERKTEEYVYAYQYLALYEYNKGNGRAAVDYSKKVLEYDASNETAQQIIKYFAAKGIK